MRSRLADRDQEGRQKAKGKARDRHHIRVHPAPRKGEPPAVQHRVDQAAGWGVEHVSSVKAFNLLWRGDQGNSGDVIVMHRLSRSQAAA